MKPSSVVRDPLTNPPRSASRTARDPAAKPAGLRPGEDFNQRGNVLEILLKRGWKLAGGTPERQQLTRPGKERGIGATLYEGRILRVFSSNAPPFEEDTNYSAFAVDALLEHGGDFSKRRRVSWRGRDTARAGRGMRLPGEVGGPETEERGASCEVEDEDPPFDFFGDTSLTGKPEWPACACPEVIEAFARDEAERIGVDTPMVAIPAIVCAAVAISDAFQIQPKKHDFTWRESPRLWAAIVADPGQKKTPSECGFRTSPGNRAPMMADAQRGFGRVCAENGADPRGR